jgi:hypothetical protein
MRITLEFKSTPENWRKEQDGSKQNTVRKVDKEDVRFQQLMLWHPRFLWQINIINTQTEETFSRIISDVTFWEDVVIISW